MLLRKILVISVAFLIIAVAVVIGFVLNDRLNNGSYLAEHQTESTSVNEETTQEPVLPSRPKTPMPSKLRSVWLKKGVSAFKDLTLSGADLNGKFDQLFREINNFGFNCVIVEHTPELNKSKSIAGNEEKSIFNILIDAARENGVFLISVENINSDDFFNAGDNINRALISNYFNAINPDAVIFTGLSSLTDRLSAKTISDDKTEKVLQTVNVFKEQLQVIDSEIQTGVFETGELSNSVEKNVNLYDTTDCFVYVPLNPNYKTTEEHISYFKTLGKQLKEKEGCFISGFHFPEQKTDLKYFEAEALIELITVAEEEESCLGFSFSVEHDLWRDNDKRISAISEFLNNLNKTDEQKEFFIINHKETDITTDESKISFIGKCSPSFPLYCNGEKMETSSDGTFSLEFALKPGKNVYNFEQNNKKLTYTVTCKVNIMRSVSPTGRITVPGGITLEVTANALRGAQVTATLGKTTVKLSQSQTLEPGKKGAAPDAFSDFVTYYGKFVLPAGKVTQQTLGTVNFTARINGITKNMTGAKVTVSALPPSTMPATSAYTSTTTATQTSSLNVPSESTSAADTTDSLTQSTRPEPKEPLTPYKYAGVPGRSLMCEINVPLCETLPFSPFNNSSTPKATPLLAGTFDYIDGESSYTDGKEYLYYNLRSGKRVYREEVKVINNGYNLPENQLEVRGCSMQGDTIIEFNTLWKVPIYSVVQGIRYKDGIGRGLDVLDYFSGHSIDFIFHHTGAVTGSVNVSGSNIVKSSEWIKDPVANTMTLRLHFKRNGVFYGHSITFNNDGSIKFTIKNKPSSLRGLTVMLDPGHGGKDPGALCSSLTSENMKYEKQINLALALKIKERLEARGVRVLMTRTKDEYIPLEERQLMSYQKKPDLFVSIHCDGNNSASVKGTSAFYYHAQSFPLADAIHKQILACYSSNFYTPRDLGTRFYPFKVTRTESCPATLIEYGHITNLNECKILQNNENQNRLAEATVLGILDYFDSH